MPLGSQGGCRRKMLTDAKQRLERGLEREKELLCQCSWEGEGKGSRRRGGNKPCSARKPTFSKGSCLLEAVVKLLNSPSASREKCELKGNVASSVLVKKRKLGKQPQSFCHPSLPRADRCAVYYCSDRTARFHSLVFSSPPVCGRKQLSPWLRVQGGGGRQKERDQERWGKGGGDRETDSSILSCKDLID